MQSLLRRYQWRILGVLAPHWPLAVIFSLFDHILSAYRKITFIFVVLFEKSTKVYSPMAKLSIRL